MRKNSQSWKKTLKFMGLCMCTGIVLLAGCSRKEDISPEILQNIREDGRVMTADQGEQTGQIDQGEQTEWAGQVDQGEQTRQGNLSEPKSQNQEPKPEEVDIPMEDYEAWRLLMEENRCSEEFKQALLDFSYWSASEVLSGGEGNANFSPLSLYYALALAGSGAKKETAGELLDVLGMEDMDSLAKECGKLYRQMYYQEQRLKEEYKAYGDGDFQSTIRLRNSLWLSNAFAFHPSYQEGAAQDFYASLYSVDFTQPETGKVMGQWIADQTNGVLTPSLSMDSNTALSIINTLYFYGCWNTKFSKEKTQTDTFTLADKTTIECPMMNREEELGMFYRGEGYMLSWLYTNNNCRMAVLLPDRDRTVQEFLQSKDELAESLGKIGNTEEDGWRSGKVIWKLPKFSFGSSYDFMDTLPKMGVKKMFHAEEADFSGISPEKLWVSQVIQESHIGIDEEGIEGAAYTMLAVCGAGMPEESEVAEMVCDRPFIYGIQDTNSGAWLFIGVCQNPNLG